MSNEAVVRLQESRRFAVQGINEGIYESKVIEQGDLAGLQVLSTNGIEVSLWCEFPLIRQLKSKI